ncbi:MAG: hypothetical protein KC461_00265 [Dehalococcoidia bacterium]|nr:hypothetical protein [Dehalococcoidia bacterium]MCA9849072.1 hypothetical protein [Dehalococcoidia bacterium]MCA9856210.1 hypothetical protein [Dehalococcoidia bacterium]MCB9492145.1 hypothetical protein [Dehalococcoidia bacterium]
MQLPAEQIELIQDWILEGRSDEEIAFVLTISVKLIRPIRAELEESMRPR